MFYWEVAKNILSGYFFRNTNERMLPKIQTSMDTLQSDIDAK